MLNRKVLRVIIKFCFWRETPSNLIFEVFPNLKIRELLEMLLKYIKPYIWDFKVALGDAFMASEILSKWVDLVTVQNIDLI